MSSFFNSTLGYLRIIGILEGISFLVLLFIAMPLKYLYGQPEAVRQVGAIHGLLFILFIYLLVACVKEYAWPNKKALLLVGLSMLPFGNFYADWRYLSNK